MNTHKSEPTTVNSAAAPNHLLSPTEAKNNQIYLSSDFWFYKGVILSQKNESTSALACYIQALKIDKYHLPSIFNLACNYEKLN